MAEEHEKGSGGRVVANVQAPPSRSCRVLPPVFGRVWARLKRLPWYRFAAGVVAGSAGAALPALLRRRGPGVSPPEVAVTLPGGPLPRRAGSDIQPPVGR